MSTTVSLKVSACGPFCGGGVVIPTPSITGFSCVSRTGNGNLRGWSKYQNHNSGDWNMRKYTRVDYVQDAATFVTIHYYATVALGCGLLGPARWFEITQPVGEWNVGSNTESTVPVCTRTVVGFPDCFGSSGTAGFTRPFGPNWIVDSISNSPTSDTTNTRTGSILPENNVACAIGCPPSGTPRWGREPSSPLDVFCYATMSVPDTIAAAQARGSPSVGSSCQTLPGTIASTTAGSTTQIAITGPTSVVVSIDCSDLVAGHDYEITVTLTRRNASDDSFISEDEVTITFTASGTTDVVDYDVPIETDVKVNFDSADSIAHV